MSRLLPYLFASALLLPGLAFADEDDDDETEEDEDEDEERDEKRSKDDDDEPELTSEQLDALRKFKRKRLRVQDVQITTTYVRGGVSTGSSTRFSWRINGAGETSMNTEEFIDTIGDRKMRKKYDADEKKDMAMLGVGMGVGGGILGAGAVLAGVFGSQMQAALDSGSYLLSEFDLDSCDAYYGDDPDDANDLRACNEAASFQPGAIAGGVLLATGGTIMGIAGYLTAWFRIAATWPGKYYDKEDAFDEVDKYNYELARELGFTKEQAKALILSRVDTRRPMFEMEARFGFGFVGVSGRF